MVISTPRRASPADRKLKARLNLRRSRKEVRMPKFQPGDYVKAEFKDEATGESEWM
jgi:hypothetical protein